MTAPVASAARIVAELRTRLKSEYGLADSDDVLEHTLEGASDLPEMLATMARDAVQAEDYAVATKGRIQLLSERKSNLEKRAEKLRGAIAWALQEAGWKRIPADALPDMGAVSISPGKAPLLIPLEEIVPRDYQNIKEIFSPDRVKIRKAIEGGERFNWASIGEAKPVLVMRQK